MATQYKESHAQILMLLGWIAFIIAPGAFLLSVAAILLAVVAMAIHDKIMKQSGKRRSSLLNVAGIFLIMMALMGLLHGDFRPELHESQIRALKSRTSTDFRIIGKALEDYHNDHGVWPDTLYPALTTPHSYLDETIHLDPFSKQPYHYLHNTDVWLLIGTGPDKQLSLNPKNDVLTTQTLHAWPIEYDPTNGIKSRGDIFCSRSMTTEIK